MLLVGMQNKIDKAKSRIESQVAPHDDTNKINWLT